MNCLQTKKFKVAVKFQNRAIKVRLAILTTKLLRVLTSKRVLQQNLFSIMTILKDRVKFQRKVHSKMLKNHHKRVV